VDVPGVPARRRRVAIVGTPRESTVALEMLRGSAAEVVGVVAHPDRAARAPGLAPLLSRTRASGVPVLSPRAATVDAAVQWLAHLALDFVVCVGWSGHLTEDMFRVPRYGVVGLRPVARDRARTRAAADWAVLRGDTLTGHVLLMLVPPVDRFPGQEWQSSADDAPVGAAASDTYDALAWTGHRLLQAERADSAVGRGVGGGAAQPTGGTSRPGLGLTSFGRAPADVHRWVQAMARTGSGAFAMLRGEPLLIWECEPAGGSGQRLPAGTILGPDSGVVVSARGGALRLLWVQDPGREAEPAADWFDRRATKPGCAFDQVDWSELAWLTP